MCLACEGADAVQRGVGRALAARARAIEAALPGARVPEEAWRIIAGEAGGAIAWRDHLRILNCLDQAGAAEAAPGCRWRTGAARGGFRCEGSAYRTRRGPRQPLRRRDARQPAAARRRRDARQISPPFTCSTWPVM
jgi:hypothetical protein